MKTAVRTIAVGSRSMWKIVPLIVFFALWELAGRFGPFSESTIFPPFSDVVLEMGVLFANGVMAKNLAGTLIRVLIGLCAGTLSGLLVGIIMGWHQAVGRSLAPIVTILYPIPTLGWLPLMMLWIGINAALPIAIITIGTFFPVCYNTAAGIRHVDPGLIKAAHILGASDKRILFEVIFPNAAPHVFAGLKLSSGMAWRTVLAAEMVAIPTGVGALIMKAESLVRVDMIMACLVVLSCMCLFFEKSIDLMERKWVGKWSRSARD